MRELAGEPRRDLDRRRPAQRIGREQRFDQLVEILGELVVERARARQRHLAIEPRQHVQRPAERRRSGDQLERDDAERVDVHRRAHGQLLDIFRREVRGGADELGLACELLLGAAPLEREPEVEQLDPVVDDEHVGRLDVAMDDAVRVQVRDAFRELREHLADPGEIDVGDSARCDGRCRRDRQLRARLLHRHRAVGRAVR
jgi:hypothetical protein